MNKERIVVDLCGGTGAWSKPYSDNGYDVRIITLPDNDLLDEKTVEYCIGLKPYGILFACDCTIWSNSGSNVFHKRKPEQVFYYAQMLVKGLRIIFESKPHFYAIENPIGKMKQFLGEPRFKFNPFEFAGHSDYPEKENYAKKTLLWGNFNIPEKSPVEESTRKTKRGESWHHNGIGKPKGMDRKVWRSITPSGFAKAFYEANK